MIDFHCHIDLYPDFAQIARICAERGLYVLSVTTTPSAWEGTCALAQGRIRTALGLHPQLAHERKSELSLFDDLLPKARYVGEIGLDGTPEFRAHWDDQLTVFSHILESCTHAGGRILSIHSRRASKDVLDCLEAYPKAGVPILHWFSGSKRDLERAIALGCWFSAGPAMLGSERGKTLAGLMPPERMLTESDGPFAQLEGRAVLPWEVDRAVAALAETWNCPWGHAEMILRANLKRLVEMHQAALLAERSEEEVGRWP